MAEIGNVDLVRLGFETFEREGAGAFRALLDLADPEIECFAAPGIEPAGTYRGKEAALGWWREWFEPWEDFRMRPIEFVEVAEGVIVVPLHEVARGTTSGVEVAVDVVFVFEIRDGRVTKFHIYRDRDQALSAAAQMGATRRS